MSTFKTFIKLVLDSYDLEDNTQRVINQLQNNIANSFSPLTSKTQNDNNVLSNVALTVGTNTINHGLGTNLQGYYIVRQRAKASIYDTQDSNKSPNLTLLLVSDTAVSVDLIVF